MPTVGLEGEVRLLPETAEDLWHTYNLICVGDALSAMTIRKVAKESSTGSVDSQRVRVTLAIRLKTIDFDPEAGELRLGGGVLNEVEGVRLGSHHTLTLETHRPFSLRKDEWDTIDLERLRDATSREWAGADLAAVLLKEGAAGGLANVCLVSGGMSIVRAKLETNPFPKQGDPRVVHGAKKARDHWFKQLLDAVVRHVDFEKVKCVVLAGPGFTKDAFFEYAMAEAQRRELRELLVSKPKWVLCHATSAYKHALKEVLAEPSVATRVRLHALIALIDCVR